MNRKIWFGFALVALVVVLGATAYTARSTPEAVNADEPPWVSDEVDKIGDVGQYASVAIAPDTGTTYVSYFDFTNGDLMMATYVGSGGTGCADDAWNCEVIDDGDSDDVGRYSSIAVNPVTNEPAIAYYDYTNTSLKLARMVGGVWYVSTIQSEAYAVGLFASLAFDSTGKIHIAHYASKAAEDELWHVEFVGRTGGSCSNNSYECTMVDSGHEVGTYASLDIDSSEYPHIAYHDGANNRLMYAYYNGSIWEKYDILPADSGKYASLFVDTDNGDQKYIAHYDTGSGTLKFAEFTGFLGGGDCGLQGLDPYWKCDDIEVLTASDPIGVSLAVDKAGYPMIAYQSSENGIKTARPAAALGLPSGNCEPDEFTWQCDIFRLGFGITMGDYLSLAFNSAGHQTIAYYGDSKTNPGNLYVAYQQPLRVFLPLIVKD